MSDTIRYIPSADRVAIVGSPGSGKSHLARHLAARTGLAHIDLDTLSARPDGTRVPTPEFRAAVTAALEGPRWVVDGNYRTVQDLVLGRADTIVFFDLPRWLVTARVAARGAWRAVTRPAHDTARRPLRDLLSRDPARSMAAWTWRQHPRYRDLYAGLAESGAWAHAHVAVLRRPWDPLLARRIAGRVRPASRRSSPAGAGCGTRGRRR